MLGLIFCWCECLYIPPYAICTVQCVGEESLFRDGFEE